MAIIEVNEIPKPIMPDNKNAVSHREEIRLDIEAAYESKISKFEFIGDYNYKYLAHQATMVADKFYKEVILPPIKGRARKAFRKEYQAVLHLPSGYEWSQKAIHITGVTLSDRKHIYGEIDYKFIRSIKKKLMEGATTVKERRPRSRKAK